MAMGIRKCGADRILRLFNWTEIDKAMLTQLQYGNECGETTSLASKKLFKHMCFMFELFFAAVALVLSKRSQKKPGSCGGPTTFNILPVREL
jgi:hypothetical protein